MTITPFPGLTPAPCSTATCSTVAWQGGTWTVTVNTPAPVATVFVANTPGVTIQNTPGVNVQNTPAPYATATTLIAHSDVNITVPYGIGACSLQPSTVNITVTGNTSGTSTFFDLPVYDPTQNPPYQASGVVSASGVGLFSAAGLNTLQIVNNTGASGSFSLACQPAPLAAMPNIFASPAPASIATSAPALNVTNQQYIYNGGTAYPRAAAPSPAPSGLPALGYNAAGAAAPIICTQSASSNGFTSPASLVAGVSGKQIYICEIDLSLTNVGSAAAGYTGSLVYSSSSSCTSPTTLKSWYNYIASAVGVTQTNYAIGNGVGLVAKPVPAGDTLCSESSSANEYMFVNIMYEQF
jgi:hypothetical protein